MPSDEGMHNLGSTGVGRGNIGVGSDLGVGGGRPGYGAGAGGPASGVGALPGAGAGRAGGPGSVGVGVGNIGVGTDLGVGGGRPGYGAGLGGPASGIGVRPGAGAGRAGVGVDGFGRVTPAARYTAAAGVHSWYAARPIFTPTWCQTHPWAWSPAGVTGAAWATAAWRAATWTALGQWFAYDAAPADYDYGNNVTYQNGSVYYGTQPVGTQQQYYQQAATLAAEPPAAPPAADAASGDQWMALGYFSLVPEGQKTPEMIFQLAVDKSGAIRGNYYDQVTDSTLPVQGSVDKKTQRAAWQIGQNKTLVVETGLYNLTKDESTALVHFSPDRTQQFVLVRMKQPPTTAAATP